MEPQIRDEKIQQPTRPAPFWVGFFDFMKTRNKKKSYRRRTLQHMIEHRLETPVFFIVTVTMVTRAAQMFSGGTLIMSKILGPNYPVFAEITGIGLGIGSEMLMTIAGRSWKAWDNDATDNEARAGMSKIARAAYVKRAKANAAWSKRVMFVGMGASLYAGLSYLFINSGKPITWATFSDAAWWLGFFTDLVAVAVVTTTVFYLGVLKESRAMTEAEEVLNELSESMNAAVQAAIARFRESMHTDTDVKLIAEHLEHRERLKFLRAVAKQSKHRVWTSKELRARLNLGNDATKIRQLNRRINNLAKDPDNGLEKAPDNKTWLIPAPVVFAEFGDEIAAADAARLLASQVVPEKVPA